MSSSNIKRLHSNLYFVSDLSATTKFYKDLGFEVLESDDSIRIKPGDFTLTFMDELKVQIDKEARATPKGIGVFTYVEVNDVDAQFNEIKSKSIEPSSEPKTYPWGKREFAVKDPDGYKIVFYTTIANS